MADQPTATEPSQPLCTCPKVDATHYADRGATLRGYSPSCRVHGAGGTEPVRRPARPYAAASGQG
jgi:hypothetical protein